MRILLVNKYYYLRSGAERYLFNLTRLLESQGHTVGIFSMHHPRNQPSPFSQFFLPNLDYYHPKGILRQLRSALRVIWYPRAASHIERLLAEFRPDIVQIHNIYHQISPSILPIIRKHNIPIIHRLHDYKLICPNYLLFTQGSICERCRGDRYGQTIRFRCLHESLPWSVVAALEMTIHKKMQVYEQHVNRFTSPSQFLVEKAIEFGISAHSLRLLPNFLFYDDFKAKPVHDGQYALFLGRLVAEKGLLTLLAASRLEPIPLIIVGEGPLSTTVHQEILDHRLSHIQLAGYRQGKALSDLIAGARFVVVPSQWYEVFGQIIMEAFAHSKPVIASSIGGIPEVVDHERDGLLVPPRDAASLAQAMRWLWDHPLEAAKMGVKGRAKVERQYNPENHYRKLMSIYGEVM